CRRAFAFGARDVDRWILAVGISQAIEKPRNPVDTPLPDIGHSPAFVIHAGSQILQGVRKVHVAHAVFLAEALASIVSAPQPDCQTDSTPRGLCLTPRHAILACRLPG